MSKIFLNAVNEGRSLEDIKKAFRVDKYDTNYQLTSEQLKAAAFVRMGGSVDDEEMAEKFHFLQVSDYEKNLNFTDNPQFHEAMQALKAGETHVFNVVGSNHHVGVKLKINPEDPSKIDVHYYNSIIFMEPTEKEKREKIDAQIRALQDLPEDVKLLIATESVEEEINTHRKHSKVGMRFSESLLDHLKKEGLAAQDATLINDSKDHQYNNNCGLAVADWIAGKMPEANMRASQREVYYEQRGREVFEAIAHAIEPKQYKDLSKSQPQISNNVRDSGSNANLANEEVAKNFIEMIGLKDGQSLKDVLKSIDDVGLLEKEDFKKIKNQLSEVMNNNLEAKCSLHLIQEAISNSKFASKQAMGFKQAGQRLPITGLADFVVRGEGRIIRSALMEKLTRQILRMQESKELRALILIGKSCSQEYL